MKRMQIVFSILVAALMLFQGAAFAKTVEGKVVSTDVLASTLTVSQTDAETATAEDVTVSVSETTTYSGGRIFGRASSRRSSFRGSGTGCSHQPMDCIFSQASRSVIQLLPVPPTA